MHEACIKSDRALIYASTDCTGPVGLAITDPGEGQVKDVTVTDFISGIGNDKASSMIVPLDFEVQLFKHLGFNGANVVVAGNC